MTLYDKFDLMTIGKPTHNSKMIVKFLLKKNEMTTILCSIWAEHARKLKKENELWNIKS